VHLPQLKVLPSTEAVTCTGKDHCKSCQLWTGNGGRCDGCTPDHKAKLSAEFQWCHKQCHSCTGYKATLTAICCRSPLKDIYLNAVTRSKNWNKPKLNFTAREQISFDRKAILYLNFSGIKFLMGDRPKSEYLVDHEVVAVAHSYVKGMGGDFFSDDLHDYLRLPKTTKIILLTMTIDDHLERSWEKELYGSPEEYEKVGISYWMPLAFSAWGDSARMYQYYQIMRTMYCTDVSQAHFYSGDTRPSGIYLDDLHLRALEKIPQVIFNVSFIDSKPALKGYLAYIKSWNDFAPKHLSFWFVGHQSPTLVHNIRKHTGDRDIYFISGKPLYNATTCRVLLKSGSERKIPKSIKVDKLKLLKENYERFEGIVDEYGRTLSQTSG
jgi:hypothetical protein